MSKGGKDKKIKDLMKEMPVKDTKLAGVELLGKPSLDTEDQIVSYITKVVEERAHIPWAKKDVERNQTGTFPIAKYLR